MMVLHIQLRTATLRAILRRAKFAVDQDEPLFAGALGEGDGGGALYACAGEGEDFAEAVFGMADEHAVMEVVGRDGREGCAGVVCRVCRPKHSGGAGRAS